MTRGDSLATIRDPMPLYPHQAPGAEWLAARSRAALCDEQGLGKTITAILAADRVGADRVLVVAPSVVAWNWAREFAAWSPWREVQVVSTGKVRLDPTAHATVVTHGLLLAPGIRTQLLRVKWDLLVIDEAHCFRSAAAKRTRVLYGVTDSPMRSLVSCATRVWPMTGTPVPNNVTELFPMLKALWPAEVPWTFRAFRERFCLTVPSRYGDGVKIVGNRREALPELKQLLDGKILRRMKKDVLDLPAVRFEIVTTRPEVMPTGLAAVDKELSGLLRSMLGAAPSVEASWAVLQDAMLGRIKDDKGEPVFAEAMARYRRLCGVAKAEAAVELIGGELRAGTLEKVVVFAHHTAVVDALVSGLHEFGAVKITGATSALGRQCAVDQFQRDARIRVLVANIVAGGTGITLTAAADVVFVELSYVPAENAQAADRIHRIGQTASSVRVRFLALAGTIDEMVVANLKTKTKMIREVLQ